MNRYFDSYGSDPRRIQYAGSETDGLSVDYKQKYVQQLQVIKDNYATFDMMAGYKAGASGLKWSDVENAFDMYQSRSIHVIQHEGFSTKNAEKYGYMLGRHSLPKQGRDKIINFAALFSSLFSH